MDPDERERLALGGLADITPAGAPNGVPDKLPGMSRQRRAAAARPLIAKRYPERLTRWQERNTFSYVVNYKGFGR